MVVRYKAEALVEYAYDLVTNELKPFACKYKSYTGTNIKKVITEAEKNSLTNEAYGISQQLFDPKINTWRTIQYINNPELFI